MLVECLPFPGKTKWVLEEDVLAAIVYIYRKIQERHFMKSIAELLENPNEGRMKFPGLSSIKRNKGNVTLTSKTSFYILEGVFLKKKTKQEMEEKLGKWITKFLQNEVINFNPSRSLWYQNFITLYFPVAKNSIMYFYNFTLKNSFRL